jgi:hypothetical protein
MAINLSTEHFVVRRMCGKPDVQEITDDDIEAIFYHEGLDWLNNRRPAKGITFFSTVANQQDYNVKPANALRVTNVWWLDSGWDVFSPDMRILPSAMQMDAKFAGVSILDNPAMVIEFYKKISEYHHNFRGSGFETDEGKIRLEPYPGSNGDKVYFEYTYKRWDHVVNISEEFHRGLRYYVASLVMDYLGIKRGMITGGKNWSGGGGSNEKDLAARYLIEAEGEVPFISPIIFRG